jgi:MFS superfamily sulfate permease-like transporter
VALAAVAISSQLGTAHLAGLLPTAGLIAFAGGAIGFAAFGANRGLRRLDHRPNFAGGLPTLAATGSRDYFALWRPPGRDLKGATIEGVLVIAFKPRVPSGTPISFKTARSAARQSCTPLDLIVLEASSIVEIDFTPAQILIEFVEFCTRSKIRFAVARPRNGARRGSFRAFGNRRCRASGPFLSQRGRSG